MRVAVISDIHANLHALDSVLAEIDSEEVGAVWCLGDLVGYGPRPNECCDGVRERADLCLVGNHDLLALNKSVVESDFNPDAAAAGHWTRTVREEGSRRFLDGLEPQARTEGTELFHASPRDPVWEYVLSGEAAFTALALTSAPLVLVGHSHVPLAIVLAGDTLAGGLAPAETEVDLSEGRWLVNPGSVGQPRDADPRAAWLLLDLEARQASFRRVAYPIERTQEEMRERGLPEPLASRLASGV
jgi:diadenosine tetraphosphatase ApaH/serine/threonine PP2A family protein phosphatase